MYYIPEKCGRRIQELRKKTNLTQNQMSEARHIYREGRSVGTGLPGSKRYLYQVYRIYNGSSVKGALPMKF